MGFGIAPASDGEISDGGAISGADDGEECVHGRGVLDSEGIASVEDWLSFGIDGFVQEEKIGYESRQRGLRRGG